MSRELRAVRAGMISAGMSLKHESVKSGCIIGDSFSCLRVLEYMRELADTGERSEIGGHLEHLFIPKKRLRKSANRIHVDFYN